VVEWGGGNYGNYYARGPHHNIPPQKFRSLLTLLLCVVATILDKTLETIPANIAKLLNIDKTNFVSPSPQFNVVNNAETT
jgi:hypothetical protein